MWIPELKDTKTFSGSLAGHMILTPFLIYDLAARSEF